MIVYKKLLLTLIFGITLVFFPSSAFAHTIDNTDTYFYYEKEIDGSALNENVVKMYSYINWFVATMLVERELGIVERDIFELLKHQDIYSKYVSENIKVWNNNESCLIALDKTPITEDQISPSLGTLVIATFNCPSRIENAKIENTLFIEDFEYQSNYTSIYNSDQLLHMFTLGRQNPIYEFNASELKQNPKGDQSVDYSAGMSAEQVTEGSGESGGQFVQANTNISNTGPKKANFIAALTDTIFLRTNSIKDQSIAVLLVLVFLLGFLHTVEAGHSKAILASSMLHNKMDVRRGLSYAAVFTVTHLGDIIIVGLILLAADNYFNILSNFSLIEKLAGYALLGMAIYLLLKNLRHFAKKWAKSKNVKLSEEEEHGHTHSHEYVGVAFKDQIILGFLAGLAPCVFGWSVFMLILSTNKVWVLIPAILSFGLGIFIALAFVVYIVTHLRKGAYNKFNKIAEFSPIISALFLLAYAIYLIA